MTIDAATPYDSARRMFQSGLPTWLNTQDAARLAAYALYENIYFNRPETFQVVMRGTNDNPIYVPSGKIICNTMNRYVCRGYEVTFDSEFGEDPELALAFKSMFKREKFFSKFNTQRLFTIIRGDAAWLITGNANKAEGTRVNIHMIDPGTVFPIEVEDAERNTRIGGVDLVEQVAAADGTLYVKRQRYLKSIHPDHPQYDGFMEDGEISYQVDSFEVQDWEDPTKQKVFREGEKTPPELIVGITKLPVYVQKNTDYPESMWGLSEMAGIETLLSGINQGVSDQDLALAIAGLGLYVTDAGTPENGVWGLGPAEVVEVAAGRVFERINGVTSVDPSLNHVNYLQDQAFRASAASDVAQGRVDVEMAESGVALQMRLGPIIDEATNKDMLILDTTDQMLYDLRQWFDVYEGIGDADPEGPRLIGTVGDKIPENKKEKIDTLLKLYNSLPALVSGAYVREELRRMGWNVPDEETLLEQIASEAEFFTTATEGDGEGDIGGRLEEEANAE